MSELQPVGSIKFLQENFDGRLCLQQFLEEYRTRTDEVLCPGGVLRQFGLDTADKFRDLFRVPAGMLHEFDFMREVGHNSLHEGKDKLIPIWPQWPGGAKGGSVVVMLSNGYKTPLTVNPVSRAIESGTTMRYWNPIAESLRP